ncbi:MAG TPA: CRTAC1 family protein [Vicinamibacterales bacterium]|nr:CRTAC1 family protein [Vicinamibacterales bacterium]
MALLIAGVLSACRADPPPHSSAAAAGAAAGESESAAAWFVDRAQESGLTFTYFNGMSGDFLFPEMLPGGVALLDYDNDGDLDVFFVQGRMLDAAKSPADATIAPAPQPLMARLFRNDLVVNADGSRTPHFVDVTQQSGIDARGYGMGVAAGDFNNDGCIDLYVTNFGRNQLFRNNCDGSFTDVSKASGTDISGWSVSAAFVDYDRDGWLDLYVGNYVVWDIQSDQKCTGLTGKRDYCTPAVYRPQRDRLFHNNRDGTFTDVTARALPGGPNGPALGVTTADFDNDGWIDIYVANDGRDNVLWLNQRNGTFKNVGLLAGVAVGANGRPNGSMGVDAGDFDNDGNEDLFTVQLPSEGARLYHNRGAALFDDVSAASGLGPMSLGYTGFGTAWFDFDNDGWLDLLVANGAIEAIKERGAQLFPYGERKLLFRNLGNGRFANVTPQAGAAFRQFEVSRGAAFGDIDNDGDIDVVISNIHAPARLLVNTVGNRRHWIGLRLLGRPAAARRSPDSSAPAGWRDMLGARVEVIRSNAPTLWRRVRSDGSYASANDPRVLVGLGDTSDPPTVRAHWPDGRVEEWRAVAVDTWTTLRQGEGVAR